MKNCKKWLACVGAMLNLLLILPFHTLAAENAKLTVTMPKTVEAGKQFVASVQFKNNPGWASLQFQINYDADQVELISLERGDALAGTMFVYNETQAGTVLAAGIYGGGTMKKDGTWITMCFRVKTALNKGDSVQISTDLKQLSDENAKGILSGLKAKGTASVGTLPETDKKTLPNKTKPSEGLLYGEINYDGTAITSASSGNVATVSTKVGGAVASNATGQITGGNVTNGGGTGTAAAGVTDPTNGSPTADQKDDHSTNGLGWWWLAIVVGGAVVLVAGAWLVLKKHRSGH